MRGVSSSLNFLHVLDVKYGDAEIRDSLCEFFSAFRKIPTQQRTLGGPQSAFCTKERFSVINDLSSLHNFFHIRLHN